MSVKLLLLILAAICFALAALLPLFGSRFDKVDLMAVGLLFFTLSFVLS